VFSRTTGDLTIGVEHEIWREWYLENATLLNGVSKVNSPYDELGPFLLYSNDESGNQDIRYTHNMNNAKWEEPMPVSFLTSDSDDAYPTFNATGSIYFCSDREGNFNIYKAITDPDMETLDVLGSGDSIVIEKDTILSSAEGDDKCPYIAHNNKLFYGSEISNNMLVFASNREGGLGGFDLYYVGIANIGYPN